MSKINDFLTEAGVFFMATEDGPQPKLRPLGAHFEVDGKILFGVGSHKNVYRQMTVNPLVEIVAYKKGRWLRYTGRAVFETDEKYAQMALDATPHLKKVYNEATGNRMMMFHLGDASAFIVDMAGNEESVL